MQKVLLRCSVVLQICRCRGTDIEVQLQKRCRCRCITGAEVHKYKGAEVQRCRQVAKVQRCRYRGVEVLKRC